MVTVSPNTVGQFKSSSYDVARNLRRSRNTQARRAKARTKQVQQARAEIRQLVQDQVVTEQRLREAKMQIAEFRIENGRLRNEPVRLPDDPPLRFHSYGARIISLCVNLASTIGLRAAESALRIVFEALGVQEKIPHWTSIRTWLCRFGVATLEEPVEAANDWIWMADHSNQIGAEKVLVILGIRASQMPEHGQAIRHQDVRVLAVIPGTEWKREDVAREYESLAERIGDPMVLLTDGASELRESAAVLENAGKSVIQLRDFKHYAANVLKKIVGKDERFEKFLHQIGRTRNAIQQTELAHFTPPPQKPKARFMNLDDTLRWAQMVLWHLSHSGSHGRQDITAKRMNKKLGWLRKYRKDVARWSRCQAVVSASLTFINQQGLYIGACEDLKAALAERQDPDVAGCEASQKMIDELTTLVADSEKQLDEGMRVPQSTEILESSFGLYKTLEKQHSKGGFTGLLSALPGLLRRSTPALIKNAFARVSVEQMRQWTKKKLGTTLGSKRQAAYREYAISLSGQK